jgi:predicted CXXCH cytochrome family protein
MLARHFATVSLVITAFAAGSCGAPRSPHDAGREGDARTVTSNALRRDYAGSNACMSCHRDIAERWRKSPMHRMTRDLDETEISAPFDGGAFHFMGDTATMSQHDGRRYMRVESARYGTALYRVSKVIGGRYREDFVGARVESEESFATRLEVEKVLPVSWLRFASAWRYKGYSVMTPERDGLRAGPTWRTTCIFCHNTAPMLSTLYDDLYGKGSPKYQGSVSFVLPMERAPRFEVTDASELSRAVGGEILRLGGDEPDGDDVRATLAKAISVTRRRFREPDLVELGIGCEACHGGSREHVSDPGQVKPTFALMSDAMRVLSPRGTTPSRAENVNRTCAKCHTVLFSRYPYTWEGRGRNPDPGGSHITSGEARDFLLGGCATELDCTSCHDPHGEDSRASLDALAGPRGDALCARCHAKYADARAARAHSHHPAGSAGSHCVACHMPRKNMGLGYSLTRYHRIGSPTESARVLGDRPLECALCHTDRSVESLVSTMERWWHRRYDRGALRRLYGDLSENVLAATLERGKPHERAVAIALAGEHRLRPLLDLVVADLDDPYPLVRFYAKDAIERTVGERVPVDAHEPGRELVRDVRDFLGRERTAAGPP